MLERIGTLLLGSFSDSATEDCLSAVDVGAEIFDTNGRAEEFKIDVKEDDPSGPGNSASPIPRLGSGLRFFLGRTAVIFEQS